MNIPRILSILFLIALFALAFAYLPQMPDKMASHWNGRGIVDGWSSRLVGLFLIPVITLVVFLLLVFLPRLDPLKGNVKKFQTAYDVFMLVFILFFSYLEVLIILANLGRPFDMILAIIPAFTILFVAIAYLLRKSKRNFFIGIRTPWTLMSDKVWERTHRLGAIMFLVVALINLLGLAYPRYAMFLLLGPIVAGSLVLVIYSYIIREKKLVKNMAR